MQQMERDAPAIRDQRMGKAQESVLGHHWKGESESLELKIAVDESCECMHMRDVPKMLN